MFEEIKSLNCFLDEIKKNLSSKFTIEEICNILQNRLYKLSQYENIIAPKKHSNEEKCFQKNINIAENITDRLKNSISENNLKSINF